MRRQSNPYELFLILCELVAAEEDVDATVRQTALQCAYMFDQCPNHKPTVESIIQSAVSVQETYAKALLVDRAALKRARDDHDLVECEEILKDAFNTDVRPLLADWRRAKGLDPNPLKAFRASDHTQRVTQERVARRHSGGKGGSTGGSGAFG